MIGILYVIYCQLYMNIILCNYYAFTLYLYFFKRCKNVTTVHEVDLLVIKIISNITEFPSTDLQFSSFHQKLKQSV